MSAASEIPESIVHGEWMRAFISESKLISDAAADAFKQIAKENEKHASEKSRSVSIEQGD